MRRLLPLLVLAAALVGCGAAPDVVVASKAFTEGVILGEIATQVLRSEGLAVEHVAGLGGSSVVFRALETGEIDVYPEYTGTLTGEILASEHVHDDAGLRAALERRGIAMSRPLGFSNTYALGMRRARAQALGLRRISDLAAHPDLRLGFTNEFLEREDGWPAVRQRYHLPQTDVTGLEHAAAYRSLEAGEIDVTDLYSTDAEIVTRDLVVLEDDLGLFPRYDAVWLWRRDLRERAPAAVAALESVEGKIDAATMTAMNARVIPGEGREAEEEAVVAADFVREVLGRRADPITESLASRILGRTLEHLVLVGVALLLAVLVGVPLGVLAARRPHVGQGVLGVVGVVQTIPALTLLVLMIPLLGIREAPAIAALFLYGLLPIVRGTHGGLTSIPPGLLESAEVLGLSRSTRLRRIELPLASPQMMSGIQTAAVMLVGFATLGALIGAGGYGQPILAGLRRLDYGRMLEGAVPAAGLAVVVQVAFDGVARLVVPRGLRLGRSH